ncbi:hypothetical protein DYB28_007288 [Aphanomyces astaci]|uniref:DDE-1 domain-containing protein n=1 Tax=Aphanomyces astaci TaxID=112090 RepID=A0A9X8DXZ0_APHAT|nr:hypothetical protein DYB28_007288 [Aphanomyces astaci]
MRQIRLFLRIRALLGPDSSGRLFARTYNIPEATFRRWKTKASDYLDTAQHGPRATLQGHGRAEDIEFTTDLVDFMEAVRLGEHFLTTAHLITWLKSHRPEWLSAYMESKPDDDDLLGYMPDRHTTEKYLPVFHLILWIKRNHRPWLRQYIETKKTFASGYESLGHLLHRFCKRHRFSHRVPCPNKVHQVVLDDVWAGLSVNFWTKYEAYDKSDIYNADETGGII